MNFPLVSPYLNFDGRCEEAVNFYQQALGAKVEMIARFKEAPAGHECPGQAGEKIMHCAFTVGEHRLMASDCRNEGKQKFEGFSLSLMYGTEAEVDRVFAALSEGGKVEMPLERTFWSPKFGLVVDRFGLSWMVMQADPNMK